jgi:hypothetical protein
MESAQPVSRFRPIGRITIYLLAVAAVAAASFRCFGYLSLRSSASSEVAVTPYTIVKETYDFRQSESGDLVSKQTEAMRSDGAFVLVASIFGKLGLNSGETVRKITFPDGSVVSVFDSISTKTTWPHLSSTTLAAMKQNLLNPPSNCVRTRETLLGFETMSALQVATVRTGSLKQEGQEWVDWRAPQLGCALLKTQGHEQLPDGSAKLRTDVRLASLALGDPEATLFDTCSSCEELRPSEALRRIAARVGSPWDDRMQSSVQQQDLIYSGAKIRH